jgi:hypothetical protein
LGLKASFEDHGFPVEPMETLPNNKTAYTECVTRLVTGSCASLHAFGRTLPEPVEDLIPLHYEFEMARTACGCRQLARSIVWIPQDWETNIRKQRTYVQEIERDTTMPPNVSVFRVSFPELKNVLRDTCQQFEALQERVAILRQIYFLYRQSDGDDPHRTMLSNWIDELAQETGISVLRPMFIGDPSHLRKYDLTGRRTSSVTLVYCGQKADRWADSQYELLKLPADSPLRRVFYITPGTEQFSPASGTMNPLETATTFDPQWADEVLRPLLI